MKDDKSLKDLEKIIKSLANRRRIKILQYLDIHKEGNVGELAEAINLSFKATSKHLRVLDLANVIEREQKGLNMLYRISEPRHRMISILLSL